MLETLKIIGALGLIGFCCWALTQAGKNIGRAVGKQWDAMDQALIDSLKKDREEREKAWKARQ